MRKIQGGANAPACSPMRTPMIGPLQEINPGHIAVHQNGGMQRCVHAAMRGRPSP